MPVNNPTVTPTARQPRPVIKINGAGVGGVIRLEVSNNQHFQSDYFTAEIALQGQPDALNWAAWGDMTDGEIDVGIGFLDKTGVLTNVTSYLVGLIDRVTVSQAENIVTIEGRDYSAALIDQATLEKFPQQTSSQIATTLATRHGLTPQVTATKTPVGSYFGQEYATTTQRQSEWDLLSYLAQKEGFQVYVRQKTLYFQPAVAPSGDSYALVWVPKSDKAASPTGNLLTLQTKREMTLARDVIVTVTSHNAAEGKVVTQTAKSVNATRSKQTGTKSIAQTYVVERPNLTAEQALKLAQELLAEYSAHERVITGSMPGDNLLTFETPVTLTGTGTSWDQLYYLDRITRTLEFGHGYTMQFLAKNHTTTSQVSS